MDNTLNRPPQQTRWAIRLLMGCIALDLITMVFRLVPGSGSSGVVSLLIVAGLCAALANRQNWARYVLLVLFLLGMPLVLWSFKYVAAVLGAKAALLMGIQVVLRTSALVLLFSRASKQWFKRETVTAVAEPVRRSQMMTGG